MDHAYLFKWLVYVGLFILAYGAIFLTLLWVNPTGYSELGRLFRSIGWWWQDRRQPGVRDRRRRLWSGYRYAVDHVGALKAVRRVVARAGRLGSEAERKLARQFSVEDASQLARAEVAGFFAGLTDEDIDHLAEAVRRHHCGRNHLPAEPIAAFLRDERRLIADNRQAAESHPDRFEKLLGGAGQ